jgi:hypothetical protein
MARLEAPQCGRAPLAPASVIAMRMGRLSRIIRRCLIHPGFRGDLWRVGALKAAPYRRALQPRPTLLLCNSHATALQDMDMSDVSHEFAGPSAGNRRGLNCPAPGAPVLRRSY